MSALINLWNLDAPTLYEQPNQQFGRDLIETEAAYYVHIDVPGVEANDIDISVADKYLEVKAERKPLYDPATVKIHSAERGVGKIHRKLRIPSNGDIDKAETKLKYGVLTVTIPKKTAAEEKNVKKLTILTE
eukprot:gene5980-6427_t